MIVKGKLSKSHLSAIDYFADSLLTKQLKKHIIIHVRFRKNLDVLGLVEVEDYNLSGKPREFILEINRNQTKDEILLTIAHEFCHIMQYCYGHLNTEMTVWKGEKVDADSIPYHEQPWEVDAECLSQIIFEEFKNSGKYK